MKKLLFWGLLGLMVSCGKTENGADKTPAIPLDSSLEARVKEIVSKMSLEDKIGQMCEVTADLVVRDSLTNGEVLLDEGKVDSIFSKYRVGSVLNVPMGFAQTPETWYRVISGVQEASMKYLGVPDIYGVDQNHGTTYTIGGTLFPQEINMAASFNRELVREGAKITAYETRACDIPWVFNPVMDLGRNPVWPRIWESFGEDPFVNGAMAVEMVKGYQGEDPNNLGPQNVAACLKHYMAYGVPASGKDRTPANVNPIDLREKFFHPYKEAIRAGALSIMVNSAQVNGLPVHASYELLTVWLKEGLNWDGMIVTDWADIHNLWQRDKIAYDYKDAIRIAINAGIDMSMTPYDVQFCTLLKELVDEGKVKMERIDDAASRVIRMKLRLGLFETPNTNPVDYPLFASEQHAAASFEMAVQSEILLKNDNLLPLEKGKRILVTGPNANSMRSLNGGWSYTWQGSEMPVFHDQYNTIFEAIANEFGADKVVFEAGMDYTTAYGQFDNVENIRIEKAVAAARSVDVIVACVGENSYTETVGNINDLNLPAPQQLLVKELSKTGKPIVLVLNGGRARIIRDIEPLAGAIVDVLLPSNYGGDALAKLLSGERNFSGKLPYTYPKWINAVTTYDHKPSEKTATMEGAYDYSSDVDVQWPFGYGLSYTTFLYSDISIDKKEFTPEDNVTISVKVTNSGNVEGMESVILYSSDLVASITPDVKRVRGFDKINLKPGESQTVSFTIPVSDLAFVGADYKWRVEEGEFAFTLGTERVTAVCTKTKVWDSQNI